MKLKAKYRYLQFSVTSLFLFLHVIAKAQQFHPGYFGSPMDTPLYLSAPFGSLRDNHFHSGMDIRTYEKTGLPVYAIADGYVSRIKYAATAYGKALYITHPNGYTSVYAHLQQAQGQLASYIKSYQYEKEQFEFDHFPKPHLLKVHKGEIIGWSGNTGTSSGPHLHFEIRDSRTEEILNPQHFGISGVDTMPPILKSVTVFTLDKFSPAQQLLLNWENGKSIKTDSGYVYVDTLSVSGNTLGFGVEAVDFAYDTKSTYSIYGLDLFVDGKSMYQFRLDRFRFDATRCMNVHIDYAYYQKENRRIQKLFLDDGNSIRLYPYLKNKGKYVLKDQSVHQTSITVYDVKGLKNRYFLYFKSAGKTLPALPSPAASTLFYPKKQNRWANDTFVLEIPNGCLYDTCSFSYAYKDPLSNTYSPVIALSENKIPVHRSFNLSIHPQLLVSPEYQSKLLVCAVTKNGSLRGIGGTYSNGVVTVNTTQFQDYTIGIDTMAPVIKPLNIANNIIQDSVALRFTISDELSGICCYRGTINGTWRLFEYDAKNNLIEYYFDEHTPKGKLEIELFVWDKKENKQQFKTTLSRP